MSYPTVGAYGPNLYIEMSLWPYAKPRTADALDQMMMLYTAFDGGGWGIADNIPAKGHIYPSMVDVRPDPSAYPDPMYGDNYAYYGEFELPDGTVATLLQYDGFASPPQPPPSGALVIPFCVGLTHNATVLNMAKAL